MIRNKTFKATELTLGQLYFLDIPKTLSKYKDHKFFNYPPYTSCNAWRRGVNKNGIRYEEFTINCNNIPVLFLEFKDKRTFYGVKLLIDNKILWLNERKSNLDKNKLIFRLLND